jgi:hypothetical protein
MSTRYAIGPREIHKFGGHYGEESWKVCDISIEPHDEGPWVRWSDAQEDRADLLAALKLALSDEGGFACPASTEAAMRAALAKAEGRG